MMRERNIQQEWVTAVLSNPASIEAVDDGTRHYLGRLPEFQGRVLRVVLNPETAPPTVVTFFFDRRLRGKL